MKTSLQIPGLTSLPSTLTAKKVYEDQIFGRQDILQFFSGESKDLQICKIPTDVIGTLNFDVLHTRVVSNEITKVRHFCCFFCAKK